MIKTHTNCQPHFLLVFFLLALPAMTFGRICNGLMASGDPVPPDSLKDKLLEGHLECRIRMDTNCVDRTVTLEAWTYYVFTGVTEPVVVPWSNGQTAHKITVTPPGEWYWDISGIGCEVVHQYNFINFDNSFFTGPVDILGPTAICPNIPAELTVNTHGYNNLNSFTWNTGYNTLSPHPISQPGLYALTVTDAFGCPFTDQVVVASNPAIAAAFTYSTNNQTITFNNISSNASSYSWNFGNGQSSTLANPTVTYSNPGLYNVCLTATGTCGSTTTCNLVNVAQPGPWTVTATGRNHTIILPANLVSNVQGSPLQPGDWVGVFYESAGVQFCGGYGIWSGTNSAFAAYGNDAQAPAKNGFNTGDAFNVKIWRSATNQVYNATAQYAPVGTLGIVTHTGAFADDGISMLSSMTTSVTHTIALTTGWNMISSNVMPDAPNMLDVFNPIASGISLVKDGAGAIAIPSPPLLINQIGNWNIRNGYQVNASQQANLVVLGQKVVPENSPITLQTGWQIIGYLRDSPQNIATVFTAIQGQISLVKDNFGKIYSPQFGINTIGEMKPGQGYKVKALSNTTLQYQANFADPTSGRNVKTIMSGMPHFTLDSNFNTGNNAILILTDSIANEALETGDEIGVFTPENVLCGAAKYQQGQNLAITVWGDDPGTGAVFEGMGVGEGYHFRVWDTTDQKEYQALAMFTSGLNAYEPDAFEVIQKLTLCRTPDTLVLTAEACSSYVFNNQTYTASGTYTQIMANFAGCDSTIILHLTINPVPSITVNNPNICAGQAATLTADGATSYLWSNGATTNPITVNPNTTTDYTVTGTTAGCSASATVTVTVNPLPVVDLGNDQTIQEGQATVLDASCSCQSYHWSTGATTPTLTVNMMGIYTVTVTSGAGCSATDSIVIMTTDTDNPAETYKISVSPNPTHELLWITCAGGASSAVQVTDNLGRIVLEDKTFAADGVTRTISLKKMPTGTYYLRIAGDGFTKTVAVVKQ